jgi:hypothetical protein
VHAFSITLNNQNIFSYFGDIMTAVDPQNDTQKITQVLVGQDVTITVLRRGSADLALSGTIESIDPQRWVSLSGATPQAGHIVFCGAFDGIERIVNSTGRVLYENLAVREEYAKSVGAHAALTKGVIGHAWFEQVEKAYDPLRRQGVFYVE